VLVSN